MVEYNIVKYCRHCRKRYLVNKKDVRKHFCDKCQSIVNKNMEE